MNAVTCSEEAAVRSSTKMANQFMETIFCFVYLTSFCTLSRLSVSSERAIIIASSRKPHVSRSE